MFIRKIVILKLPLFLKLNFVKNVHQNVNNYLGWRDFSFFSWFPIASKFSTKKIYNALVIWKKTETNIWLLDIWNCTGVVLLKTKKINSILIKEWPEKQTLLCSVSFKSQMSENWIWPIINCYPDGVFSFFLSLDGKAQHLGLRALLHSVILVGKP